MSLTLPVQFADAKPDAAYVSAKKGRKQNINLDGFKEIERLSVRFITPALHKGSKTDTGLSFRKKINFAIALYFL